MKMWPTCCGPLPQAGKDGTDKTKTWRGKHARDRKGDLACRREERMYVQLNDASVVRLVHVPWSPYALFVLLELAKVAPTLPLEAKPRGATSPYVPLQVAVKDIKLDWEVVKRLNA